MKKILFLMCLFIGFVSKMNAQITVKPSVDRVVEKDINIIGVMSYSDGTVIFLDVGSYLCSRYVRCVCVSPKIYIEYINPQLGCLEKKQILGLRDIDGNVLKMGARYYREDNIDVLCLLFPNLPQGVNKINLIGEKYEGKWYGIHIKPVGEDVVTKRIATTENEINQLIINSKDSNAGTYEELSAVGSSPVIHRLAFIQNEEGTFLVYVGCIGNSEDFLFSLYTGLWKCGEVKALLRQTVVSNVYNAEWYTELKIKEAAVITFEGAKMTVHTGSDAPDDVYIKMAGSSQFDNANTYSEKWLGTGFALKGGYVLTNYHVVDGASIINIYGVDGDFITGVKASVIGSDKSNDLALLKMVGNVPSSFDTIPYGFKSKFADVGEDVYVLGYPLTATMGEEVKLTNGIISAKTGFEGNVSQYQISVPVQPGNSGGPLIDYNGNVIGVVCAKHLGTENVSYAVKTSQVRNLIESVSDLSIMNTTNTLQGRSLKDQVKSVNKYVYIIKCSK